MRLSIPAPAHREAGFTLAEMLVTLGILALVAGLLASGVGGAWLAMRQSVSGAGDGSVAAAQRILRTRIERLAPVIRADAAVGTVDAEGDSRMFGFAAPPPDRSAPDGFQSYRLLLSPAGDLMLYQASLLDQTIDLRDRGLAGWQPVRLLQGVADIDISYFGPAGDGSADRSLSRWQSHWHDRPQAPALVRVRLTFARGDRRIWPDLIVRPRATVNAACRIHAGTGRCEGV